MQEAIPYKPSWLQIHANSSSLRAAAPPPRVAGSGDGDQKKTTREDHVAMGASRAEIREAVTENALIVFGRRGCCMSHVVKQLLLGLGVNPAVYEVEEEDEKGVADELGEMTLMKRKTKVDGEDNRRKNRVEFPAVFIGGKLFGGLDRVMGAHISGDLVPLLREAGALWL